MIRSTSPWRFAVRPETIPSETLPPMSRSSPARSRTKSAAIPRSPRHMKVSTRTACLRPARKSGSRISIAQSSSKDRATAGSGGGGTGSTVGVWSADSTASTSSPTATGATGSPGGSGRVKLSPPVSSATAHSPAREICFSKSRPRRPIASFRLSRWAARTDSSADSGSGRETRASGSERPARKARAETSPPISRKTVVSSSQDRRSTGRKSGRTKACSDQERMTSAGKRRR